MRRADGLDLYLSTVLMLLRATEAVNSFTLCQHLATALGASAARASRYKYRNTLRALDNFFGTRHDDRARRRIARQTFRTFWLDAFVLCNIDWRTVLEAAETTGLEYLENARSQGRGVIVLENSYFGLRNLAKRILQARGWQIHQTHAMKHLAGFYVHGSTAMRQRMIRPAFERRESSFVASIEHIPSDGSMAFTRKLAQRLAGNGAVYFSGDGDTSHKFIRADFLGQRAPFPTGIINLARLTGAPVVPMFCYGDTSGKFVLRLEPPLEFPDSARAAETGMQQYAALYTSYIDAHPGQYRNWHSLV